MIDQEFFAFEFHSLVPIQECKTINDALKTSTLKIFGRTRDFKSVCANVVAHLPYFYVVSSHDSNIDLNFPFGTEKKLQEFLIDVNSFRTSVVEKMPFYNFYEGTQKFIKIECCSEMVRKRLMNFVKDSADVYFTLYEVTCFVKK